MEDAILQLLLFWDSLHVPSLGCGGWPSPAEVQWPRWAVPVGRLLRVASATPRCPLFGPHFCWPREEGPGLAAHTPRRTALKWEPLRTVSGEPLALSRNTEVYCPVCGEGQGRPGARSCGPRLSRPLPQARSGSGPEQLLCCTGWDPSVLQRAEGGPSPQAGPSRRAELSRAVLGPAPGVVHAPAVSRSPRAPRNAELGDPPTFCISGPLVDHVAPSSARGQTPGRLPAAAAGWGPAARPPVPRANYLNFLRLRSLFGNTVRQPYSNDELFFRSDQRKTYY